MTSSVSLVLTVSVEVSFAGPDGPDGAWAFAILKCRYISELDVKRRKGFGSKSKVGAVAEVEAAVDEFSVLHQRPRRVADFDRKASFMSLGSDFQEHGKNRD